MYILVTSLKQTAKLFASSIICSALFVHFYDATYSKPLMGFLILLAAMLLFTFICDKFFFSLCDHSDNFFDYFIPSGIAFAVYVITAYIIYFLDLRTLYNWLFLPTRFVAPLYPERISYVISYIVIFLMIMRIPINKYYHIQKELEEFGIETIGGMSFFSRIVNGISVFVYSLSNIVKYTVLLFAASALCSIFFIDFFDDIYAKPLVHVVLLLVALAAFLFVCDKLFFYLCGNTETTFEHLFPSLCAFAVYVAVALILYYYRRSDVYNWLFLPTRFIEPVLPAKLSLISYIISFILLFGVIIRISLERYFYIRQLENDEELRAETLSPLELDDNIM